MPIIRKFCCCTNLITGSIIYGWILTVLYTALLLITAINMMLVGVTSESLKLYSNASDTNLSASERSEIVALADQFQLQSHIAFIIVMVASALGLFAAIFLALGAQRRSSNFVIPFLIFDTVKNAWPVYITLRAGFMLTIPNGWDMFGPLLIATAILIYLWLCVVSLYQHLRDLENQPPQQVYLMQPCMCNPYLYHAPNMAGQHPARLDESNSMGENQSNN